MKFWTKKLTYLLMTSNGFLLELYQLLLDGCWVFPQDKRPNQRWLLLEYDKKVYEIHQWQLNTKQSLIKAFKRDITWNCSFSYKASNSLSLIGLVSSTLRVLHIPMQRVNGENIQYICGRNYVSYSYQFQKNYIKFLTIWLQKYHENI